MKTIFLHGKLKTLIDSGRIDIDVKSPLEAIRFLCGVMPGFAKEYLKHPYCVRLDEHENFVSNETAALSFGKVKAMHIIPDARGAKVGGAPTAMSPDANAYEDREDDSLSALFNGGINTTEQGMCVPVIYGRVRRAGSAVVSAGIAVEEIQQTNPRPGIDWPVPPHDGGYIP